jgi:hypothetical protein
MRDVVRPFIERSTATSALVKLGRTRGYGDEWSRDTKEWREAEAVLQAAAPKRKLSGPPVPWPDCLEQLSADELQSFARFVKSPEWRDMVRWLDLTTAVFGMLAVKDTALFPERDRIVEQVQREGASTNNAAAPAVQERLRGANQCERAALLEINMRYMPLVPGEVPDAARLAAPYLERFEARNSAFHVAWMLKAVNAGDLGRVNQLLDHGADINGLAKPPPEAFLPGSPVTPLYVAVRSRGPNKRAMLDLLITRGAAVNARTSNGRTALFAAYESDLETVKYLVEKGADVLVRDLSGERVYYISPPHSPVGQFLREKVREAQLQRAR